MLQSHVQYIGFGEKKEEILPLLTGDDNDSGDNI